MKCPKCHYLGFETGDRCKNCGYDFSLLPATDSAAADYEIHPEPVDDVPVRVVDDDALRISITPEEPFDSDRALLGPNFAQAMITPEPPATVEPEQVREVPEPAIETTPAPSTDSALPLFTRPESEDDEPLIRMPAAPRPPLAVRRTPDTPRLRAVPRPPARRSFSEGGSPAPVLQFAEEILERHERAAASTPEPEPPAPPPRAPASTATTGQASRPGARVVAALIDHVILLGIDAAVVYFTVRMAGLSMDEWRLLPVAPMLTFVGLLKMAYFYSFTAVGGQTIGKMAVGTCVVSDSGGPVDAARAMRRTSAGLLSFLLLGLGFVPALFGDHRALHDRLAGTRVVRLRSA